MQDVLVVGAGVVHYKLVLVAVGEELPELALPGLVARVHARVVPGLLLLLCLGRGRQIGDMTLTANKLIRPKSLPPPVAIKWAFMKSSYNNIVRTHQNMKLAKTISQTLDTISAEFPKLPLTFTHFCSLLEHTNQN